MKNFNVKMPKVNSAIVAATALVLGFSAYPVASALLSSSPVSDSGIVHAVAADTTPNGLGSCTTSTGTGSGTGASNVTTTSVTRQVSDVNEGDLVRVHDVNVDVSPNTLNHSLSGNLNNDTILSNILNPTVNAPVTAPVTIPAAAAVTAPVTAVTGVLTGLGL